MFIVEALALLLSRIGEGAPLVAFWMVPRETVPREPPDLEEPVQPRPGPAQSAHARDPRRIRAARSSRSGSIEPPPGTALATGEGRHQAPIDLDNLKGLRANVNVQDRSDLPALVPRRSPSPRRCSRRASQRRRSGEQARLMTSRCVRTGRDLALGFAVAPTAAQDGQRAETRPLRAATRWNRATAPTGNACAIPSPPEGARDRVRGSVGRGTRARA